MQPSAIEISTDKKRLDIAYSHQFLSNSYWAKDIPLHTIQKAVKHSLCFGVYHEKKQIGFARIITDYATYAYLADVFIDPAYQKRGYAKKLMHTIMEYPELQGLRVWMLRTWDAHRLYEPFGFMVSKNPEHIMDLVDFDIYKKTGKIT